ncbi:MAG TPA: cupin domain-containing protein, partial [Allosphingosinicella sp.]|nr:cupin domain-containing protein [Allosphingosinicella sp.]
FLAEYHGRKPLHLPRSDSPARPIVGWQELNALLAIRSHWTEANLKLVMNSRPVAPDFYLDETDTSQGRVRRANPAKVEVFLNMGASLVANAVEEVSADVRAICAGLAGQFGGRAGANLYCSSRGVQAFASHCDPHEVFAVQCEGEKSWNIYANRAAAPVEALEGPDAQATIDRVKGPVAMKVEMRPGDLLYIPRGFYHDALASSGASLHVTFSVAPLTGRILFRMLEEMAIEDQAFREYLPDARGGDEAIVAERLAALAARAAEIITSPRFSAELADRQRQLAEPDHRFTLPERPTLDFFARTDKPADLTSGPDGAVLRAGGQEVPIGTLAPAAEWALSRRGFALQELLAGFRYMEEAKLRQMAETMQRLGLFFPYRPEV